MSELIERQAAIDAIVQCTNCGDEDTLRAYVSEHNLDDGWTGGILEALDAVKDLPPAQSEPSIPIAWIEGKIKWLNNMDNYFAELTANIIKTMLNEWRKGQTDNVD